MPHELLAKLPPRSLHFATARHLVTIDGVPPATEQTYLQIEGTPDGFRYLAALLLEHAATAERTGAHSAVLAPSDLPQVIATEWRGIEVSCRQSIE